MAPKTSVITTAAKDRTHTRIADRCTKGFLSKPHKCGAFAGLLRECLNGLHGVQRLFAMSGEVANPVLSGSRQGSDPATQSRQMGTTTKGTTTRISSVSFKFVTKSKAKPPKSSRTLRKACDRDELITLCTTEVSAVRRDKTSPVRVSSKKLGDRPIT